MNNFFENKQSGRCKIRNISYSGLSCLRLNKDTNICNLDEDYALNSDSVNIYWAAYVSGPMLDAFTCIFSFNHSKHLKTGLVLLYPLYRFKKEEEKGLSLELFCLVVPYKFLTPWTTMKPWGELLFWGLNAEQYTRFSACGILNFSQ